jgi:hypothetical protein
MHITMSRSITYDQRHTALYYNCFTTLEKPSIHLYFETSVVYKMFIINHQFIKNLFIHVQIDIKKDITCVYAE